MADAVPMRRCKVLRICDEKFVVPIDVVQRLEREGALGDGVSEKISLEALVELEAAGQVMWLSRNERRPSH